MNKYRKYIRRHKYVYPYLNRALKTQNLAEPISARTRPLSLSRPSCPIDKNFDHKYVGISLARKYDECDDSDDDDDANDNDNDD